MVNYLSGGKIRGSSTADGDLGTGLKAYYKFNESSGNIVNVANTITGNSTLGTGQNITMNGDPTYSVTGTPSSFGNAVSCDGSGDYGQFGTKTDWNFLHTTGATWTINVWLKFDASVVANKQLFDNTRTADSTIGLNIRTQSSNRFRVIIPRGVGNSSTLDTANNPNLPIPTDNAWHMYTFRWDQSSGNGVLTYNRDGANKLTKNGSGNGTTTSDCTDSPRLFSQSNSVSGELDSEIAEMSIFNTVLTDAEVTRLYNSGSGRLLTKAGSADEKTTIINVPTNTHFEETDTRKIWRRQNSSSLGTPDLEISDASGWSTSGSGLSINSSGVITQTSNMSANARLEKSLGFTLGNTWTIDYEFTRTSSGGNNVRPLVVASSADNINDSGTDNDVLGHYGDTNFNTFKKVGSNAGAPNGWIGAGVPYEDVKLYLRMSRTSDTNFRLEVYTDSARTTRLNTNCGGYTDAEYNFNGCSVMNSVGNGMIDFPISAGTVTDLDTLISGNGTANPSHSGTIENIKVYNNQIVQSNVAQKYGYPTTNADVGYGTYKQIRNLIPDDIITGVTLSIYNASADFKVAIFTESSNSPSTILGGTTTKTGVSVSNTYTNYEITLDTPVAVPSDGKVWVCAYPSTTIKYAVTADSGDGDWYNSRYGGTSASYSSAFPSTMWGSTGEGTYNPMFGVIIGKGQWKERGVA